MKLFGVRGSVSEMKQLIDIDKERIRGHDMRTEWELRGYHGKEFYLIGVSIRSLKPKAMACDVEIYFRSVGKE